MTPDEYIAKLLEMPERFEEAYWKKEYNKAKYIYDTALRVTEFLDVPKDIVRKLFCNQVDDDDNIVAEALFETKQVQKVYEMCVVRSNQAFENECYRRLGQAPRYYPEPRYPVEKMDKK